MSVKLLMIEQMKNLTETICSNHPRMQTDRQTDRQAEEQAL